MEIFPIWVQIVLAVIAAIGGISGVAAFITALSGWKKAKPDIAKAYEEMATKQAGQIAELRTEVNTLSCTTFKQGQTIQKLRQILKNWAIGIRILLEQLTELDQTPAWTPEDCDLEDEADNEDQTK